MSPNVRITILIIVDVLMIAGLGVLLFMGDTLQLTPIFACVAVISYVTFSIYQIWKKAKTPG